MNTTKIYDCNTEIIPLGDGYKIKRFSTPTNKFSAIEDINGIEVAVMPFAFEDDMVRWFEEYRSNEKKLDEQSVIDKIQDCLSDIQYDLNVHISELEEVQKELEGLIKKAKEIKENEKH